MLKTAARTGALALALLALPASAHAASPPMMTATQWSLSTMAGFPTGLEARATDPDGDAVTITWTYDDGTTATGERPGKVWDTPGTHTATATATDATGLTTSHTFTIEITPNPNGARPVTGPPPGWVPPDLSARPQAALADAGLKLSKARAIPVRVSCKSRRCKGAVALARAGKPFGKASFSARPDKTATAYVRVSRPTAKLLRRRASVPVVVTVAVDGADPATVTRTLALRTR